MNDYQKILKFVKNHNSLITIEEFKRQDISYYFINKLIEDGIISRADKGIYMKTDSFEDIYFIIQNKFKKSIFSYNTALYILGETEVTPNFIEISVPRSYHIKDYGKQIIPHYISDDNYKLGAIKVKSVFGNEVVVYNLERTICDIVKNGGTLDKEQINKIIRKSFLSHKINGDRILKYAKNLKCEKKIKAIMEVMI